MTNCKYCYQSITFDDYHMSKRGKKVPLDVNGRPHKCTARVFSVSCRTCGDKIHFSEDYVKSGKKIPLSGDNEPHQCGEYVTKCNDCGMDITFSDDEVTAEGKHIPLGAKSGGHYRCSAKPFNKSTRRAWWYEQEAKASAERERRRREYDERTKYEQRQYYQAKETEYCELLEIPMNATEKEIKEAYRRKALLYHPDRNSDNWDWANQMMQKLNEAYENVNLGLNNYVCCNRYY